MTAEERIAQLEAQINNCKLVLVLASHRAADISAIAERTRLALDRALLDLGVDLDSTGAA